MMTYDVRNALEDYIGCRRAGLGVNEALQLLYIAYRCPGSAPALCDEHDAALYDAMRLGIVACPFSGG